jgi:hypothetical protein
MDEEVHLFLTVHHTLDQLTVAVVAVVKVDEI